ncbi:MAG: GntP family permease [bacterium]|nr:GntP family permease [bacterium]
MVDIGLLGAVLAGIVVLLVLILRFKIQAFISLLISSILVGLLAGLSPSEVIATIQEGMGSTLGFVATVVGLGAMFGAILEHSGGAEALARSLIAKFGEDKAPWALMLTGLVVAIPVFFDVAFIILVPIVYALQRKTGKSLLFYAFPLLAGLGAAHVFIPPTPGPVAVADILNADLGWVIVFGIIAGLPAAIVGGPIFTRFLTKRMQVTAPEPIEEKETTSLPSFGLIVFIIGSPIVLIVLNTLLNSPGMAAYSGLDTVRAVFQLIGHPFTALIIANLLAWIVLGLKRGSSKETLLDIMTKSMGPAGIIILLTGAGGVFKQMLVNTGAGEMMATFFADKGLGILFFAYISAILIRVLQGSATVAMITAAGLVAPVLVGMSSIEASLVVIAIAAGATILSHVNDSGFWLVSKYLGLTEVQTLKSWSVATTLISVTGFLMVLVMSVLF